jgi:hypothetical protein
MPHCALPTEEFSDVFSGNGKKDSLRFVGTTGNNADNASIVTE